MNVSGVNHRDDEQGVVTGAAPPVAVSVKFRREAIARSSDQGFSQISLATPLSFKVYAWSAAALTFLAVMMLGLCSHAVTEKLTAVIVPENGITRIRGGEGGIVLGYRVAQGEKVTVGQPVMEYRRLDASGIGGIFADDAGDKSDGRPIPRRSDIQDAVVPQEAPSAVIVSPMDGTLYRFEKPIGEAYASSESVALIARDGPLSVKLVVSERVRDVAHFGMQVPVTIHPYKARGGKKLKGTVVFVSNAPSEVTDYKTMETSMGYEVVVRIDGKQSLPSRSDLLGRSAGVQIVVEKKKLYQWLFDPVGAIFE